MTTTCSECHSPIPEGTRGPTRRTCGGACRMRRSRRLQRDADALFREQAADLVFRQTEAIIAQDAEALERVIADAARLFA